MSNFGAARGDPWKIDAQESPAGRPWQEQARLLVRFAVLAPSGHNSQPWRFRIVGETIELRADRSRALPAVDPDDRELTISCGAALFHLRIAMRHFGVAERIELLPDPDDRDLLARVRLGPPHAPDPEEERLFQAIPRRHTNRLEFEDRTVPASMLAALRETVEAEGANFALAAGPEEKGRLARLVAEGDRRQRADPAFRRELAAWLHPDRARRGDGMSAFALPDDDEASYAHPLLVRTFDWGTGQAARDREIADCSPALVVLGTDADTPADWLHMGQALDRMLLHACSDNLSVSYLNQAVEVPDLREALAQAFPQVGRPQLVLRLGYGPPVPATPRRALDEVID